jgi:hypothetical protein
MRGERDSVQIDESLVVLSATTEAAKGPEKQGTLDYLQDAADDEDYLRDKAAFLKGRKIGTWQRTSAFFRGVGSILNLWPQLPTARVRFRVGRDIRDDWERLQEDFSRMAAGQSSIRRE